MGNGPTSHRAGPKHGPDLIWGHPVCFSDAYQTRPSEAEFRELLKKFDKVPTFGMLRNQAALVSCYQPGPVDNLMFVQSFLYANLIDGATQRALRAVIPGGPSTERPVFHRRQLLFVLKCVLLYAGDGAGLDPREDMTARQELGKACLMANDLLFTQEQEAALTKSDGGWEEWERVHDELYSQMMPNAEMMRGPDVYSALARNVEYLEIFERKSKTFHFRGDLSFDPAIRTAEPPGSRSVP
ncbi:MAG TPA: hypothetical protein VJX67_11260 [Blastocatellia bacterium]|nr:hypothetical protein [Blastocatellia bacterium]